MVTINALSDASGLQSTLRADGINAVVNYDPTSASTPPTPAGSGAVDGGSSAFGKAPAGSAPGQVSSQSTHQGTDPSAGSTAAGSSTGPAPLEISLSTNGPDTITIPASDVNNGYVLRITTGGSVDAGLGELQFDWTH